MEIFSFCGFAFEVAYEDLASGESTVRDAAVSEIAKMSFHVEDLYPPSRQNAQVGRFIVPLHSFCD